MTRGRGGGRIGRCRGGGRVLNRGRIRRGGGFWGRWSWFGRRIEVASRGELDEGKMARVGVGAGALVFLEGAVLEMS